MSQKYITKRVKSTEKYYLCRQVELYNYYNENFLSKTTLLSKHHLSYYDALSLSIMKFVLFSLPFVFVVSLLPFAIIFR